MYNKEIMATAPALKYEVDDSFEATIIPKRKVFSKRPKPPPACILVTDSQVLLTSTDTLPSYHTERTALDDESSYDECSFQFGTGSTAFPWGSSFRSSCSSRATANNITQQTVDILYLVGEFLETIDDDIALLTSHDAWTENYGFDESCTFRESPVTTSESAASDIYQTTRTAVIVSCPEAGCLEPTERRRARLASADSSVTRSADYAGLPRRRSDSAVPRSRSRVKPNEVHTTASSIAGVVGKPLTSSSRASFCRTCALDGVRYRPSCPLAHEGNKELRVMN